MEKAPKTDLMVIGTARKPNGTDLQTRGLSGLPDTTSSVALRRAEFEADQVALRKQVELLQGGDIPVSFLRTRVGGDHQSNNDSDSGSDGGKVLNSASGDGAGNVKKELIVGDGEQASESTAHIDGPTLAGSIVANDEVCEAQKGVRNLRHRSPIQIHPYAREREAYMKMVKAGRLE
ncbi:MAG: hypothetical protein Q9175_004706 [Cornicularia normoerica]